MHERGPFGKLDTQNRKSFFIKIFGGKGCILAHIIIHLLNMLYIMSVHLQDVLKVIKDTLHTCTCSSMQKKGLITCHCFVIQVQYTVIE